MKAKKDKGHQPAIPPIRIVIQLSEIEQKALHWWRKHYFNKGVDIGSVACYVLLFGLHKCAELGPWITKVARYCAAEDIHQGEWLLGNLKAYPGYKAVRIPRGNKVSSSGQERRAA